MIKKTVEDYINLDEFEILSEFISASKPLTVRCKKHNQIFTTSANNVFRGCDKCKYEHHLFTDLDELKNYILNLI